MGFDPSSHFFTSFRTELGFPFYSEREGSSIRSNSLVLLLYILCVLVFTAIISALGTRGSSKLYAFLRGLVILAVLAAILIAIYTHGWVSASTYSGRPFRIFNHVHMEEKGSMVVGLGLLQGNITLSTDTLYFNEEINWLGTKDAELDYEKALLHGWPAPILEVAEYLSIDEGGLRWMRGYRSAGFVAYVLMWAAVIMWIVTIILSTMVALFAAVTGLICGILQLLTVICYSSMIPKVLEIPLHNGDTLVFAKGWSFYLTLVFGLITVFSCGGVIACSYFYPQIVTVVFHIEDDGFAYINPFDVDEELKSHDSKEDLHELESLEQPKGPENEAKPQKSENEAKPQKSGVRFSNGLNDNDKDGGTYFNQAYEGSMLPDQEPDTSVLDTPTLGQSKPSGLSLDSQYSVASDAHEDEDEHLSTNPTPNDHIEIAMAEIETPQKGAAQDNEEEREDAGPAKIVIDVPNTESET